MFHLFQADIVDGSSGTERTEWDAFNSFLADVDTTMDFGIIASLVLYSTYNCCKAMLNTCMNVKVKVNWCVCD